MNNQTPGNFTKHPYNSITHKSECETVARNIMVILSRTGNTFRVLDWNEYKAERLKDGNFTESEKTYFDRVVDYCATVESAMKFSPGWAK